MKRAATEASTPSAPEPAATLAPDTIETFAQTVADEVAARLKPCLPPPGWPEGRGTLSEPEAATYLGIGQDFLRELRQEGRISYTAQGRRVTYGVRDIVDYLERCRQHGTIPI